MTANLQVFLPSFLSWILLTVVCVSSDTNLALGKFASQSGTYRGGREAAKAIDGITNPGYDNINCAMVDTSDPGFTGRKDYAWWQVDLGDFYNISSVTIYSDDWSTLTKFEVYISNAADVSDAASRYLCHTFDHQLIGDYFNGNDTESFFLLNCTRPRVGAYVTIASIGGQSPTRMTLCEVEVDGYKYYYCDNCLSSSSCNHTHGCSQCSPGYTPPECSERCSFGHFGINCNQPCQPCPQTGMTCDPVSGDCPPCTDDRLCQPNQARTETNAFQRIETTTSQFASSGMMMKSEFVAKTAIAVSIGIGMQLMRFSTTW